MTAQTTQYTVGIYLGKTKHVATILDATRQQSCQTVDITLSRTSFQDFERCLKNYSANPGDFVIGCEATGHYGETLLRWLQSRGYAIVRMNPAQVVQFRRGLGRRAKTDTLDADAMARQLSVTDFHVESPPTDACRGLQRLTRLRYDRVGERSRWMNRVRGLINQIYPEIEPFLKKIVSPTSLAVLSHYPSRVLLAAAPLDELTTNLKKASRGQKGEAFARTLQQTAQDSIGLDTPWLVMEMQMTVQQLLALTDSIRQLEQEIQRLTETVLAEQAQDLHRPLPLTVDDFPVGTHITIGSLLGEIGSIERFPSAKHLVSYFGWCPETKESGVSQSPHPKMSRQGNHFARRSLWMLAVAAIRCVPEYKTYFQQRVKAGKNKMKSVVAVGRKLLCLFYAMLKSGKAYDPKRYLNQQLLPAAA